MNTTLDGISGEPIYNWKFSRNFPQLDSSIIDRPNFIDTIVDILTTEIPVVFLEGDEGDGATTTLAQFTKCFPEQTFSLFIKPASRFAYNVDYLRLALSEQLNWYVNGKVLDENAYLSKSEFETLVHLTRRKNKSKILYFVVDGLHQIPKEDEQRVMQIIREILPLGIDNFRFIITGQQAVLGRYINNVGTKPYQQLKFRPEDTEKYLKELKLNQSEVLEIHKMCKGIPGRIASVRRLLSSGRNLQNLLSSEPAEYLEFIKLEFDALKHIEEDQQKIVANLTFSKRNLSRSELIEMTGSNEDKMDSILQVCGFLNANSSANTIDFISESHRRFAEKYLNKYEKESLSLQIDYLLRSPNSEAALRFLPSYYQQLNEQQAIIDLLSGDHYTNLLEKTQSITALRNRADLGARSAAKLKQENNIFKFSLQRSIFIALESQEALESEVSALVELNQSQKALTLANRAVAKEDRLSLLAAYAKRVKEKRGAVDAELVSFIKEMANQIDFSELKDKAIEIAANVLFFDQDLAISIVEQANKYSAKPQNLDRDFTQLSITASLSKAKDRTTIEDKVQEKISDSALQKLAGSLSIFVKSISPAEVISTAEQLESTHRLYFLKSYISYRRDEEHILDIVDYALDLIVKETAYTPKSSDYSDLSIPLPYATKDKLRLEKLISRFESQVGLVAKAAFSKDIVSLQMRLAHAEMSFDIKRASERIGQLYFDVATIKTQDVQSECFAIMLRMLKVIDKDNILESDQGYRAVINKDITVVLDSILENTADHFLAISGALRALAIDNGYAALDLSSKLNTENRRDEAYSTVAKVICEDVFSDDAVRVVIQAINSICESQTKTETVINIFEIIERNNDKLNWLNSLNTLIDSIEAPYLICELLIISTRIRISTKQDPNLDGFKEKFDINVIKIDSKIVAIDYYFKAAEILAKVDISIANKYYDAGNEI